MAKIQWIKIATGLPSNKKIKQIRRLPEGDTIALMWVFLMCLAGDINDYGLIYFTPEIPYTDEMLAEEFDIDVNTVRLGLQTFEKFGMIRIVRDVICLDAWEKWQNADKLSEIREYNRLAQRKHRAKQKERALGIDVNDNVNDKSMKCQPCQDTDIDIDIQNTEYRIQNTDRVSDIDICQQVVDEYHNLCPSLPRVRQLTDKRKSQINSRLKKYSLDDFKEAFTKAEQSDFLKGSTGWKANFDFLINEGNMVKVLEGNYENRKKESKSNSFNNFEQREYGDDFERRLLNK